jgi:gliding motility-associated-like protein
MPGGQAVFENLSSVSDNSALTYQWNFGDGGNSTQEDPSHGYAASGSYNVTLTATTAAGCTHATTKIVDDFYDKPIANFSATPLEICQGQTITLAENSSAPNSTIASWAWDFDDNTPIVTDQLPDKQFNQAGVFDVKLTVKNAVGCESDPFVQTVTVHLQPEIDAGRSFVVPSGTAITFEATANSADLSFAWTPAAGLSDPQILNPSLTAVSDETYTLTATGDFGCTATDFLTVKILQPVTIPNVFSPNGDNIHDKWMIPNLADYPGCTVEVFNRYGQTVFYSKGYNTPWDGTYKGKDMPVGAYYYVIHLHNGFKPLTGSITILR